VQPDIVVPVGGSRPRGVHAALGQAGAAHQPGPRPGVPIAEGRQDLGTTRPRILLPMRHPSRISNAETERFVTALQLTCFGTSQPSLPKPPGCGRLALAIVRTTIMDDYSTYARFYDLDHGSLDADLVMIEQYAALCGSPILELACGTGRALLPLARQGYQVTGVDISPAMLAIAGARSRPKGSLTG